MRWVVRLLIAPFVGVAACAQEAAGPPRTVLAPSTQPTRGPSGLLWPRPRSDERQAERDRMLEWHLTARDIHDPVVVEAMRNVPRHWFVPERAQAVAYADNPLAIGHGQTISQPYIVALMTQALELEAGDKVLEIGTGSGYQAAVLAEITPYVFTIEIVEPLARRAAETLARHGYETISLRAGDGYAGWAEEAPFDAVMVTCAPEDIPPKLIEQLAVGGRMCIPVGPQGRYQQLVLAVKQADGTLKRRNIAPVAFVPMTGGEEER